jgi:hypothetical protein
MLKMESKYVLSDHKLSKMTLKNQYLRRGLGDMSLEGQKEA